MPRFIETSAEINDFMKVHVVNLIRKGLNRKNKKIFGSKIVIMGLAYKRNIEDVRESPSKDVIEFDPFVTSIKTDVGEFFSEASIRDAFREADCVVFVTDHEIFKKIDLFEVGVEDSLPIIIDCRNIFEKCNGYNLIGIDRGDINNTSIYEDSN